MRMSQHVMLKSKAWEVFDLKSIGNPSKYKYNTNIKSLLLTPSYYGLEIRKEN